MDSVPELKKYINSFNFDQCSCGNQGFSRVLIQLFGYLGNGKSSFINTCKYALEGGTFKTYANVAKTDGGNTINRISYPITSTLTLVDNRGCSVMNSYETGEIFAQLGNLLPLDQLVEWGKGYDGIVERIVRAEKSVKTSDFVYPVYVHSVQKGIAIEEMDEIKYILSKARDLTGIFPYIVMTHKISKNLPDVTAKFRQMGAENMFPLENFTPVNHVKTEERTKETLKFFYNVIEDIIFRVNRVRNPLKESLARKEFVLKFVHEREMYIVNQQMVQQVAKDKRTRDMKTAQKQLELEVQKEKEKNLLKENEELKRQLTVKKEKMKKCNQQ